MWFVLEKEVQLKEKQFKLLFLTLLTTEDEKVKEENIRKIINLYFESDDNFKAKYENKMIQIYKITEEDDLREYIEEKMILKYSKFINTFVNRYLDDNLEIDDLSQEAKFAFIESFRRFNPFINIKFMSYVYSYVDGKMKNYSNRYKRMIPVEYHAFENYKKYKQAVEELTIKNNKKPTDKEVLNYLKKSGISYKVYKEYEWTEDKIDLMKNINVQTDIVHYNTPVTNNEDASELMDLIEDTTIKSQEEYAISNYYRDAVYNIFNEYNKLGINDKVIDIIKLRNGMYDDRLKKMILDTIKRVGRENFGLIDEKDGLTLVQVGMIFNLTLESIRNIENVGMRQLQILAGTNPELEIKEGSLFKFMNRDLNIKKNKMNELSYDGYDMDIISINNGEIRGLKPGVTNLTIHDNSKTITYSISVKPKKSLKLRKEK